MGIPITEMEFERIMNMLRAYEWILLEKKVIDRKLEMVVEKHLKTTEEPIKETILTRAKNALHTFGWKVVEESTKENIIKIKAEKTLGAEIP